MKLENEWPRVDERRTLFSVVRVTRYAVPFPWVNIATSFNPLGVDSASTSRPWRAHLVFGLKTS